jgi:hypothetical protein
MSSLFFIKKPSHQIILPEKMVRLSSRWGHEMADLKICNEPFEILLGHTLNAY